MTPRVSAYIPDMERANLTIEGMTCEHCVRAIKGRLEKTPGVTVQNVQVGSASIQYDEKQVSLPEIVEVIADEGYTVAD
jgi:copper chaperone